MSDELNTQQPAAPVTAPEGTQPAANTPPETIPYDRFKQVNDEKKKLADQLQKLLDAEKERTDAEAIKRGDFEAIINDLKPKAARVAELEATVQALFESALATVPEQFHGLIIGNDAKAKLDWINVAKATGLFGRVPAPQTDAGAVGDPKPLSAKLTDAQREMARKFNWTDEQYIKHMNA